MAGMGKTKGEPDGRVHSGGYGAHIDPSEAEETRAWLAGRAHYHGLVVLPDGSIRGTSWKVRAFADKYGLTLKDPWRDECETRPPGWKR